MIANKEAIVLDGGANNVFVGPDNQFKIVIDEFDGTTVKAWHVETAKAKTGVPRARTSTLSSARPAVPLFTSSAAGTARCMMNS